jgi:hypothetical protein
MSSKVDPKTAQEEVKTAIEELHNSPGCRHCGHNSNAEKPLSGIVKIEMTKLATKVADKVAKEYGVNENCFVCLSIHSFMKKPFDEQMKILAGRKHD